MSKLQSILEVLATMTVPGATGKQLDEQAARLLRLYNCEPAFLNYKPEGYPVEFPATICVSINNEVIHGIPDDRKFEDGDLVKIDIGLKDGDEYDDGALTVMVGHCSAVARRLTAATKEALDAGCAAAKAGNTTYDIARAITAVAEREGFAVIKGYGGHGIGEKLHMEPHVPNEPDGTPEVKLVKGQRIAIEPMFSSKRGFTTIDEKNKWTVKLVGGGIASHFERTVTV